MGAHPIDGVPDTSVRGFSQEQIADSLAATKGQPAWLNWVASPTAATRDFAKDQLIAVQLAYVVAVLAIFISEFTTGHAETWLLWVWLAESFANLVLRVALFRYMLTREPAAFTGSMFLRLVPLISNVIVGCHWAWSVYLFVGDTLDSTTLVFIVAFILLSVAAVGISAASPITAVVYPGFLWVSLGIAVGGAAWASPLVLLVLLAGVMMTLGITFFTVTTHVRRYLVKSDEVELLLARLQCSNDQLAQSNAALDAHRCEALAELEARSEYFSAASHDLRQRLHALKLLSGLPHANGKESPHGSSSLPSLRQAVEELQDFLTEVLEFARCEYVAQELHLAPVNLQSVFQQLNLQFEDVAAARSVELRFRTTTAELVTDRLMLSRVLENVVSNAIKFSRTGGKVLVAARRRGAALSIEVWDQGVGIPSDAQQSVFRPFYQLPYYSRRVEGVGLGLAIVQRLTEALGYSIQVNSAEGRGTSMKIVAPAGGHC